MRHHGLEPELRNILKEKGLRDEDPFDELIVQAYIIDIDERLGFHTIVKRASKVLSENISYSEKKIEEELIN